MAKITIVVGLCASGKSHYIKKLSSKTGAKIFGQGEDQDEGFTPLVEENFESLYLDVVKHLLSGKDCICSDISLCREELQEYVTERLIESLPEIKICWVFFENNIEQANKNVVLRAESGVKTDARGHIELNDYYTKIYSIPEGAKVIPVFVAVKSAK